MKAEGPPDRQSGSVGHQADGPHGEPVATPSRRSLIGLDWFVFFVADVQTGFGTFVAVYLTASKWTQTDIGLVLTVGGLVTLVAQIPAGAIVDRIRMLRAAAAISLAAIGVSAFLLAAFPMLPIVMVSRVIQAGASCILGVALASISLNLVGEARIGPRLGRNAAFMSAGTGLAAAGMAAVGYYVSNRAVFFVAAALVVPALVALLWVRADEIRPAARPAGGSSPAQGGLGSTLSDLWALAHNRGLLVFAGCFVLFQMANASMLPLAASMLTLRSSHDASALVGAAIVVPQIIVTVLSPLVGIKAQTWGRRPLLLIGFAALPVRGLLFALTINPHLLVAVQVLDGVSAAVLGVLVPLTIADVAGRSGRFNLAQGTVGCAVGIGASLSTTVAGYLTDRFGSYFAFLSLAGVAAFGFLMVWLLMPETRPAVVETALPEEAADP